MEHRRDHTTCSSPCERYEDWGKTEFFGEVWKDLCREEKGDVETAYKETVRIF